MPELTPTIETPAPRGFEKPQIYDKPEQKSVVLNNGENGNHVAVPFKLRTGEQEAITESGIAPHLMFGLNTTEDTVFMPDDSRSVANPQDLVSIQQVGDKLRIEFKGEKARDEDLTADEVSKDRALVVFNDHDGLEVLGFNPENREIVVQRVNLLVKQPLLPQPDVVHNPVNTNLEVSPPEKRSFRPVRLIENPNKPVLLEHSDQATATREADELHPSRPPITFPETPSDNGQLDQVRGEIQQASNGTPATEGLFTEPKVLSKAPPSGMPTTPMDVNARRDLDAMNWRKDTGTTTAGTNSPLPENIRGESMIKPKEEIQKKPNKFRRWIAAVPLVGLLLTRDSQVLPQVSTIASNSEPTPTTIHIDQPQSAPDAPQLVDTRNLEQPRDVSEMDMNKAPLDPSTLKIPTSSEESAEMPSPVIPLPPATGGGFTTSPEGQIVRAAENAGANVASTLSTPSTGNTDQK